MGKGATEPQVKRVLLATGDLKLKPDHHQEPDAPGRMALPRRFSWRFAHDCGTRRPGDVGELGHEGVRSHQSTDSAAEVQTLS